MDDGELPLCDLLSAAFVAFVVEGDSAVEQRIAHVTTSHGARGERGRVWLASLAMWFNCLRWLEDGPLTIAELRTRARMGTNVDGMRRWGYVTVDPAPPARGPKRYAPTATLTPTRRGRRAAAAWARVPAGIEARWRERFSDAAVTRLRDALTAAAATSELALPDYLPILGHGLFSRLGEDRKTAPAARDPAEAADDGELPLVSLLARVLLALALAYEPEGRLSLAVHRNALAVLDPDAPVPLRELPVRAGVAKEGMEMALGVLERVEYVRTEPLAGRARGRQARLTESGMRVREAGLQRLAAVEAECAARVGAGAAAELRAALEPIVGDGTRAGSPLFAGLTPPPGTWRADVPPPERLPRFPLVLHRGGYPDGS